MNILIIAYFFPPTNGAGSLRPYYWAKYWSEAGHNITVLTRCNTGSLELPELSAVEIVSLPHFDVYSVFRRNKKATIDTIVSEQSKRRTSHLKKLILFFQRKTGILSSVRMPEPADFWFFPAKKWLMNSNKKWDFVISTCGPYVTHCIGYKAKILGKTKFWVADYRDLWSYNELFKGFFPFSLIERLWEINFLKASNILSVATTHQRNTLLEKSGKTPYLSLNGIDIELYRSIPPAPKNDNTILLCFTGTLYREFQDIVPFFKALSLIRKKNPELYSNIVCKFIGTGLDDYIYTTAEKYNIKECVICHKYLSYEETISIQRAADILLFFDLVATPSGDSIQAMPTKLLEYVASENTILYFAKKNTSFKNPLLKSFSGIYYCDTSISTIYRLLATITIKKKKHFKRNLTGISRKNESLSLLHHIEKSKKLSNNKK